MKQLICITIIALITGACQSEVSEEKRPLVKRVNKIVRDIDANHRVRIMEDDFHQGDSIYKIRGYFMDDNLLKLVGILHTSHIDRDDYFYFDNNEPIFSGHLVVEKDDRIAAEYKYYYGGEGKVEEALFWQDHYEVGKRFPHERFEEFEPDVDSLKSTEEERLQFFLSNLDLAGYEIKHLNENLEANLDR